MIAASGTIRIPTRCRPLTRYHNLTKIQASTQVQTRQDNHSSLLTDAHAREKVADVRLVPPATGSRTVPSLRDVTVGSQMNPSQPHADRHPHQLTQPPRPGHAGGRGPAPRSRRNRTPNGPGYSPLSHHSAHLPKPNTEVIHRFKPAFLNFLRRPHSQPGLAVPRTRRSCNLSARSADHNPSRNNYCPPPVRGGRPARGARPPITAKFRLPQVPRHLRRKRLAMNFPGFGRCPGIKTGQNANLENSRIAAPQPVYGDAPGATQRTSMEVD